MSTCLGLIACTPTPTPGRVGLTPAELEAAANVVGALAVVFLVLCGVILAAVLVIALVVTR